MSEKRPSNLARFFHNVLVHFKRVVLRIERPSEAISGVRSDARKLRHAISSGHQPAHERKAQHYLDKGRKLYNHQDYSRAEEYFKSAIKTDTTCGYAYTYLGHTLYKLGRHEEAVAAWRKAVVAAPGSAAAEKAEAKLRKLDNQTQKTANQMENRLQ